MIDFQFELNTRKYKTLLNKELDKKEIQEGLIKACDVIDLIIEVLRGSRDLKMAKACLMSGVTEGITFKSEKSKAQAAKLRFTERQATAILEMRLYKLIGLEIEALMKEHDTTMKNIARYSEILNNYDEMLKVIIADLDRYKKAYAQPRKTSVENAEAAVFVEKKMEEMPVKFLMDRFGYCRNTDRLCIFTEKGKLHTAKIADLPYGKFRDKAFPIDNFSNFDSSKERMICICSMEELLMGTMLFVTKYGMTKVVSGYEYDVRTRTSAATKLNEDDEVLYAGLVGDNTQIVLQSAEGVFLKFAIEEIPEKKKAAIGVRAMKLSVKDSLEQVYVMTDGEDKIITYKEKEVSLQKLKNGTRDQKGTKIRV